MPPGAPAPSLAGDLRLLLPEIVLLVGGILLLLLSALGDSGHQPSTISHQPIRHPHTYPAAALTALALLAAGACLAEPWRRLQLAGGGVVPFLARPDALVSAFHGFV